MTFPPRKAIDRLYLGLGLFTNLYLVLIAVEFFANLHLTYPNLERFLDALSEPYLGALAVYVVLKEIAKHRRGERSLHRGAWYVAVWLGLLAVTTFAVALTERYPFDTVYQLIIANSLAALVIYIGAHIHKP